MCGIFFAVNNSFGTKGLDGFLKDSFMASQVRGVDASGMFQVKNTFTTGKVRDVRFVKDSIDGTNFLYDIGAKELLASAPNQLATVCHVRAATAGKVVKENSHPFTVARRDGSRIIGVHNGSLRNWKAKKDSEKYDVDSHWLYSKIAEDGMAAFDSIDGAYALVWYDSLEPDTLFIARNKERPLFWGITKDGKTMIGASEVGMLGWLADRNSIEMKQLVKGHSFVYPEEGYLYKINMKNLEDFEKIKLPEYDVKAGRYDRPPVPASRYEPAPRQFASMPSRYPASTSYSSDEWFVKRQKDMLDKFKLALKTPVVIELVDKEEEEILEQNSTDIGSLTDDERAMLAGFMTAEEIAQDDKISRTTNSAVPGEADGAVKKENFEYMHNPPKGNVSVSEELAAKNLGVWGLCVNFCGYMYDAETGLTYGDFRTVENGETHVYDSIVRGTTKAVADIRYINPSQFTKMVVVGISRNMSKDAAPFLILEDRDKARPQSIYRHPYRAELAPSSRSIH